MGFSARWRGRLVIPGAMAAAFGLALGPVDAEPVRQPDGDPAPAEAASLKTQSDEAQPTFAFEGDGFAARFTASATLDRALLLWDDGRAGDAYLVGNTGSSVDLEGEIEFGDGWVVGAAAGLAMVFASSDEVDQDSRWGLDNRFDLSTLYLSLGQGRLGTLVVGYADTATDGIDGIDLSGADAAADADVSSWNADFFIRPAGAPQGNLRWGDFVDGTLAGDTRLTAGYATPAIGGFEISAAVGEDYFDAALRYQGEWAGAFEVEGGIGTWRDRFSDSPDPVDDAGWGGSFALRHIATGLNAAVSFASVDHAGACADPGALSGRCPASDAFLYLKGGIVRDDLVDWGATSFYGEFYRGRKRLNQSDPATLAILEQTAGSAGELRASTATVWGIGVVQAIETSNLEIYLGYRHYDLDVGLLGADGPVDARKLNGFDAVMAGARVSF